MSKTEKELKQEFEADYKCEPSLLTKAMFSDDVLDKYRTDGTYRNTEHRGNGSSTHYYELPKGATELRHIIKYKNMEHGIGEAFCALYRLNDNGEYLRNLKKAKFYIDAAIEYEESK
jgi:hypothetical protein